VTPATLLRGLDEIDPEFARANLNRYRIVQAEQVFSREDVQSLRQLVEADSLARRNRDLLTDVLRKSEAIGVDEQVAGLAMVSRLIFVVSDSPLAAAPGTRRPVVAERVMEADATVLARDLAALDYEKVQGELFRYRIIPAEGVLSPGKRRLLADAIDKDSSARRNRDLLTSVLRRSGTMTNAQRVIGVSASKRVIYVLAAR